MYRGTPPLLFDVPEFPTLRRIKPLPKRRRTTSPESQQQPGGPPPAPAPPPPGPHLQPQTQTPPPPPPPLDPLVPPEIAEELLARVDDVATRAALQNYYIPILGNVQHFLASHGSSDGAGAAASAAAAALAAIAGAGRGGGGPLPMPPLADLDSIEFGVHFAAAAAAAAAAGLPMGGPLGMVQMGPGGGGDERADSPHEEDDDYAAGHVLGQPGNTKKRKVPAKLNGGLGNAGEGGSPLSSSYLDEDGSDGLPGVGLSLEGQEDPPPPPPVFPPPPLPGQLPKLIRKRGKLGAATVVGLQHKEQVKARKRQLAAVMGGLSAADTLALDQALSFNHLFASDTGEALKVRKSKRRRVRLGRAMKDLMERPDRKNRHPDAVPFPECDFTFEWPSPTTDRLISTKEEIAALRKRFEAELERQAGRAGKVGSEGDKPVAMSGQAQRERERDRAAREKKAKSNVEVPESVDVPVGTGLGMEAGGGKGKGKKKKRSALANASNPHHLRNYVPSRLPNSGPVDGGGNNNIWPLAVRFLSAEIPGKGERKTGGLVQVTQPGEEWICAFCEYELFYGDEGVYRKAVRNRKKVLRRRRRAAERAAAAAGGGNTTAKTTGVEADGDSEEEEDGRRPGRKKEGPDKE